MDDVSGPVRAAHEGKPRIFAVTRAMFTGNRAVHAGVRADFAPVRAAHDGKRAMFGPVRAVFDGNETPSTGIYPPPNPRQSRFSRAHSANSRRRRFYRKV